MKKNNFYLSIGILSIILALFIFSLVITFKVVTKFNNSEIYSKIDFQNDMELGIVVTVANLIGELSLIYYLFKKEVFKNFFKPSDD